MIKRKFKLYSLFLNCLWICYVLIWKNFDGLIRWNFGNLNFIFYCLVLNYDWDVSCVVLIGWIICGWMLLFLCRFKRILCGWWNENLDYYYTFSLLNFVRTWNYLIFLFYFKICNLICFIWFTIEFWYAFEVFLINLFVNACFSMKC